MEITQADRDKLRENQHKLNPKFSIGNLIEHKSQDPKKYKASSRQQESLTSTSSDTKEFKISYQSKYLPSSKPITTIKEDRELEIPISTQDVQTNLWLNMDQVELDKLEWMTSKAEKLHKDLTKGSTLFDKNGIVIRSDAKPGKNGDQAAEVEGHDLESLIKLLDSTYQPQVVYGLNVITRIASHATMGYYDASFDENIHQLLLKNCLLRVRYRLDSPNETICQSAIKCLRELLCNNKVDEVILDRIHPIIGDHSDPNLWLETVDMSSKEFTIEMKDIECVEIDAVKALIERTDLITRFTHLLINKTGNLGCSYQDCILDILIRIARHSPDLACLLSRRELMTTVINIFLPCSITTENDHIRPLSTKALKLIRLVSSAIIIFEQQRLQIPKHLGARDKLPASMMSVLSSYVAIDCLGSISTGVDELCKLHLETLRCLKTFSLFKQFKEDVTSLLAMHRDKFFAGFQAFSRMDSTKSLGSKISFDWQYAAHLIDLIGSRNRSEINHPAEDMKKSIWNMFAKPIVFRWLNDITRDKVVPHLDVSIAIVTALNHFKERSENDHGVELRNHLFNPILENREKNGTRSSNIFNMLARAASQKSQLSNLLKSSGRLRDPVNLPSFGWLQFNSDSEHRFKLDPLFETDSPYLLLDVFLTQLDDWNNETPEAINIFLGVDIIRYLRAISGYQKESLKYELFVQQSFASQIEIRMIIRTILLMGKCYISLPEPEKCPDLDSRLENEKYEFRKDDFGNLCYYAISTIGLLFEYESRDLRDKLFRKLLLNQPLQEKICIEYLSRPNGKQLVSYTDGEINNLCFKSTKQLLRLTQIYDCCIPVDRFWIFQPFLLYYEHVIKDAKDDGSKMRNPKWLIENMPWREQIPELQTDEDAMLISAILNFNYKLMIFSASYFEFVIKPHVEDYICMIGIMFLHDDLFLDPAVSRSISANMQHILCGACPGDDQAWKRSLFKDASKKIETFELLLADYFNRLVDQYESVSYGDVTFTNLLLLFLSPYSDKVFKLKFFQEKLETCVPQTRISVSNVWAAQQMYFTHKEKDKEVRELYQKAKAHTREGGFLHQYLEFHTS